MMTLDSHCLEMVQALQARVNRHAPRRSPTFLAGACCCSANRRQSEGETVPGQNIGACHRTQGQPVRTT